jgi:hypothetical protein
MAGTQTIATALAAAIQLMVAAITTAITASEAPATTAVTAAADQITPVVFSCTPAQARADALNSKLPGDTKTSSLNKPNISILLAKLGDCSNSASWTETLQVNIEEIPAAAGAAATPAVPITLIKVYGQMNCNQMVALTARGETTHDLLNNLVKAYATVECEEFHKEFEEKKPPQPVKRQRPPLQRLSRLPNQP